MFLGNARFRKIFIVGSVASGKSTLARRLAELNGIPLCELDEVIYERASGKKRSAEQISQALHALDAGDAWVAEGVLRESCVPLLGWADCIVFLDTPIWVRHMRIVTRFLRQKFGIEACGYRPTLKMLRSMFKWTSDFERNRAEFIHRLEAYSDKLIIIQNADKLVRTLKEGFE